MNILMVSSEAVPFSKTGGLADVASSLSLALAALGHDVHLIIPRYASVKVPDGASQGVSFTIDYPCGRQSIQMTDVALGGVKTHLIEHPWFNKRKGIYGDTSFTPYMDNALRFDVLTRSALQFCKTTDWHPHIIHCHDWTTGFLPYELKRDSSGFFQDVKTVFTIHNLAYQGEFPRLDVLLPGLGPDDRLFSGTGTDKRLNMLKSGLEMADIITTVSPTYAKEIQTEAMGCGLDELLRRRSARVFGILNGIDGKEWNPASDALLPVHYDCTDLSGKRELKRIARETFKLQQDDDAVLIGIISRLAEQKGFYELTDGDPSALERMLTHLPIQIVLIGTGDTVLEDRLKVLATRHPNLSVNMIFSNEAAHVVEAGSDFFLMPSRYEPCGLNQMYSLAYGTVPIVRKTGGLADSVLDIDDPTGNGTGIVFEPMTGEAIYGAVERAVQLWQDDKVRLDQIRMRGMTIDFSWSQSAREYERIYNGSKRG